MRAEVGIHDDLIPQHEELQPEAPVPPVVVGLVYCTILDYTIPYRTILY